MFFFIITTAVFLGILILCLALGRRHEIMANWEKYRRDPFIVMSAFLYKPEDDPRSRWEFAEHNFRTVSSESLGDSFKIIMLPVFQVFHVMLNAISQGLNGLVNVREITAQMYAGFSEMFDIFLRRFGATLQQLRMTMFKLQTALQRVWGVAMNAVWQSITLVQGIFSMYDLMVNVILVILGILVGMVIFLFMFAWGVIPLIIMAVTFLASAGVATGGMLSIFCFGPETPIIMADGSTRSITDVRIGDILLGGTRVTGTFEFQTSASIDHEHEPMYDVSGIPVSGSHIMFDAEGTPMFVADSGATPMREAIRTVYCLNTDTHRIPCRGDEGNTVWFADWEEVSDDEPTQREWNRLVFQTLNPGCTWDAEAAVFDTEAVLPADTAIACADGVSKPISELRPGMMVQDGMGGLTRVTGVVECDTDDATETAVWVRGGGDGMGTGVWHQQRKPVVGHRGHSLFTESGTFQTSAGWVVRDFSDVGVERLPQTYSWVLNNLRPNH